MDINLKQKSAIIDLTKRFDFKLLLLFGSRSSGYAREDSDYDLAYLSSRDLSFQDENLINSRFCDILMTYNVDTVNLKTAGPLLLKQILDNNKIIYEETSLYFSNFEVLVLQKYREAKPLFDIRHEHIKNFIYDR